MQKFTYSESVLVLLHAKGLGTRKLGCCSNTAVLVGDPANVALLDACTSGKSIVT